jgi:hypothetical protein
MKETVPNYFKFNRRTVMITSTLMIGIPGLVYYLCDKYSVYHSDPDRNIQIERSEARRGLLRWEIKQLQL